jgi:hypothetical protein
MSDAAPQRPRVLVRAVAALMLSLAVQPLGARAVDDALDWDPNSRAVLRFTGTRWSMIYPDRDFEGGCVVGYLAFSFSPTGYFVFNNRVRGSWRIDELGNLKLRTRDGRRFTLVADSVGLRPVQDLDFIHRGELYAPCDN